MQDQKRVILFTGETSGCSTVCVEATIDDFAQSREANTLEYNLICKPLKSVKHNEIRKANVLIMPGGDTWPFKNEDADRGQYAAVFNRQLQDSICENVLKGGIYVGVCGGAFLALEIAEFRLSDNIEILHRDIFGNSGSLIRGHVGLKCGDQLPKPFQRVINRLAEEPIYYEDGPVFACKPDLKTKILAKFGGKFKLKRSRKFSGRKGICPHEKIMSGKCAIVAKKVGKGCVVLVSPHPELTSAIEKGFFPDIITAARAWISQNARRSPRK